MSVDIPVLLIKVDLVGSSWYSVRLDTIDEASGCQGSHLYLYLVPRDIVHPTNEAKKLKKNLLENSFQITSPIKSLDITSAVAADHAN